MKIREILAIKGQHVHTIEPDRTVLDAVALLVEHGIGALLVRDAGGVVAGIISERDVLRVSRERSGELGAVRIGDVMTRDLVICVPDDETDYAMGIVTKNRVRHLPVMDGGHVAGMISIGDLVKARLDAAEYENPTCGSTSRRAEARLLDRARARQRVTLFGVTEARSAREDRPSSLTKAKRHPFRTVPESVPNERPPARLREAGERLALKRFPGYERYSST